MDSEELRFLMEAVWHEVLPIQLAAVRLCERLSGEGVGWAKDLREGLYLDPDIEALL